MMGSISGGVSNVMHSGSTSRAKTGKSPRIAWRITPIYRCFPVVKQALDGRHYW